MFKHSVIRVALNREKYAHKYVVQISVKLFFLGRLQQIDTRSIKFIYCFFSFFLSSSSGENLLFSQHSTLFIHCTTQQPPVAVPRCLSSAFSFSCSSASTRFCSSNCFRRISISSCCFLRSSSCMTHHVSASRKLPAGHLKCLPIHSLDVYVPHLAA